MVPRAEAFNLLGQEKPAEKKTKKKNVKPVTHIKSKVTFNVMTEDIDIYTKDIPGELINHIKYVFLKNMLFCLFFVLFY